MGHKQCHGRPIYDVEPYDCSTFIIESVIYCAHNSCTDACAHASADESGRHQRAYHGGSDHVRNGNLRIFWLHILVGPRQSIGWTRIL